MPERLAASPKCRPGTHELVSTGLGDEGRHGDGDHEDELLGFKKFQISPWTLARLSGADQTEALQEMGGVEGILKKLEVNGQSGVVGTAADLQRRRTFFGDNESKQVPPRTFWFFTLEALSDSLVLVLLVCGVASIAIGIPAHGFPEGFSDGAGIFLAVFIIVTVAAASNHKQSLQFHKLNQEKAKVNVQVTRSGRRQNVVIDELVVGDVLHLSIGNQIAADGLLLESFSLALDESSMTGESELVPKNSSNPFLLAGCSVMDGMGSMLVTSVGSNTEWGRTMAALSETNEGETPLQVRLTAVATLMGIVGLATGIFILVTLVVRYSIEHVDFTNITAANISSILNFFTLGVSVLVIAIPEGLPLAVTLTLAFSVLRMMEDKSLVRKLAACETMGSATAICSDKTGTLTMNQMAVTVSWAGGNTQHPSNMEVALSAPYIRLLHEGLAQNTSGSVYQPPPGEGRVEVSGSPTEAAILQWGVTAGLLFEETRSRASVLEVESFSSEKKVMGVLLRDSTSPKRRCHWKGASEMVVENCSHWMDAEGNHHPIAQKKAEILAVISNMAHMALRTICLAYREIPPDFKLVVKNDHVQFPSTGLTLLAVVGIKDPCRPEVPASVLTCKEAGINVRMVTGDNIDTAKAIARECHILSQGGLALLGTELRALSPEELEATLPHLQVVARASPSDKLLLVKTLKEMGEVVAVTGDGTNDAPALREADIGLAMGQCGTEVAKHSADIIILDDNFASIVKTVSWGRSVQRNIQRFLQFQITTSLVAILLNLVAALVKGDAPLTVVQMLWLDLIQDTFGALALASEPPSASLLKQLPVDRNESLITGVMLRNIVGQSAYQLALTLLLWFRGKEFLNLGKGLPVVLVGTAGMEGNSDSTIVTILFTSFVLCQIMNQFNCRKLNEWNVFEGILKNRIFLAMVSIEIACQVFIVEWMGELAGTTSLSFRQWLLCLLLGALGLPVCLLFKMLLPLRRTLEEDRLRQLMVTRKRRLPRAGRGQDRSVGEFERLEK
eukprot:TRINITY_DN3635_c0_g1_i1.p1 TRINITY_DN3635_c0_g1~~TRINITY_DN3635_c0_g1_i1.p1  ORF type:complete len:1016 (-),score=205.49 TRINITY_DN3635_c0_g1_i1:1288-4335(-)